MTRGGQGTPPPLSGTLQMEIVDIGALWRLALVDGVVDAEEAAGLHAAWDRFSKDAGLLAATVDLIATACAGARGMESKRFIDKVMPLKRKRPALELVWAANDAEAA